MSGPRIIPEPIAQLPWRVILLVTAIGCFGLVVLYSAAGGSLTPWAKPQGVRFFVLLAGSLMLSRLPLDLWRRIAMPGYLILVVALVLVELLGAVRGGSQRWLDVGFIRLQPSELMKLFIVLGAARFYELMPPAETRRFSGIWPVAAMIVASKMPSPPGAWLSVPRESAPT